jgi:hypothetical protein
VPSRCRRLEVTPAITLVEMRSRQDKIGQPAGICVRFDEAGGGVEHLKLSSVCLNMSVALTCDAAACRRAAIDGSPHPAPSSITLIPEVIPVSSRARAVTTKRESAPCGKGDGDGDGDGEGEGKGEHLACPRLLVSRCLWRWSSTVELGGFRISGLGFRV